jgi:hypothetical protein
MNGTANNYMAGNLGIGTTSPTSTLTVAGTLSVSGNTNIGANLSTTGLITAGGNITGANLITTGLLSVAGNANVGYLAVNRQDTGFEGGQLQLNKALDNNPAWYMDVYGNTGSPTLRFFNGDGQVRSQLDWNGQLLVNSLTATTGQITPTAGSGGAGIIFPPNPGGGIGDFAAIQYYPYNGEQTVLALTVRNDTDDLIQLDASGGTAVLNYLTVYGGENVTGQLTAGSIVTPGTISTSGSIIGGYVQSTGTLQGAYVYSTGEIRAGSNLITDGGSVYAKGRHVSYFPQWGNIGGQFTPPRSPFGGIFEPPGGWLQGGGYGITGAYVYPPAGFSISNFAAGIVSNQQTEFRGDVDGNDTFVASFSVNYGEGRIELVFGGTETRGNPYAFYMFWWSV